MSLTSPLSSRRWMRALAPIAVGAAVCLTAGQAAAVPATGGTTTEVIPAAAGWLSTQFSGADDVPAPGGDHFGTSYAGTYYANYGMNADVIFGLAAAKSGGAALARAIDYLKANIEDYGDPAGTNWGPYDGSLAKTALAAMVAGEDPTSFGGYNLMQTLKDDECTNAANCTLGAPANIYSQTSAALVVLAEARAGGAYAPSADALAYLLSFQCADGSFNFDTDPNTYAPAPCGSTGTADTDTTAYAIMALQAAGGHQSDIDAAVSYLQSSQVNGQYWMSQGVPNTNSTGLAAAALAGQGKDTSATRTWLAAQQVAAGKPGAGALKYAGDFTATTDAATSPSVIATAQGLMGLAANGSLATLDASGITSGVSMLAPVSELSSDDVQDGKKVAVTGGGFAAGEKVRIELHSTPLTLATVTAGVDGVAKAKVKIPAGTAGGAHAIVLTGLSSGLTTSSPLTVVTLPDETGSQGPGSIPEQAPGVLVNAGASASTQDADRSILPLGLTGVGLLVVSGGLALAMRRRSNPNA